MDKKNMARILFCIVAGIVAGLIFICMWEADNPRIKHAQILNARQIDTRFTKPALPEQIPEDKMMDGIAILDEPSLPTYDIAFEYQEYVQEVCGDDVTKYNTMLAIINIESEFDPSVTSAPTSDGTVFMGLVQMSSKYYDYECTRLGRKFDPYNAYDAIDYLSIRYDEEYVYWNGSRGYDGDKLMKCIAGSYNKGRGGYKTFIKSNGYDYYYTNKMFENIKNFIEV